MEGFKSSLTSQQIEEKLTSLDYGIIPYDIISEEFNNIAIDTLGGADAVLELFEKAKNQKPIYIMRTGYSSEGGMSLELHLKLNISYSYIYSNSESQSIESHELEFSVIDDNVVYAIRFSLAIHNEELMFTMNKRETFSLLKIPS